MIWKLLPWLQLGPQKSHGATFTRAGHPPSGATPQACFALHAHHHVRLGGFQDEEGTRPPLPLTLFCFPRSLLGQHRHHTAPQPAATPLSPPPSHYPPLQPWRTLHPLGSPSCNTDLKGEPGTGPVLAAMPWQSQPLSKLE